MGTFRRASFLDGAAEVVAGIMTTILYLVKDLLRGSKMVVVRLSRVRAFLKWVYTALRGLVWLGLVVALVRRITHVVNTNHWSIMEAHSLGPKRNAMVFVMTNIKLVDRLDGAEEKDASHSLGPGLKGTPVSSGQVAVT